MTEPRATRPHIPGYGIPEDDGGTLPWSWARGQLEQALIYWVASVKPDTHAHLMPTWGAWVNDRFYFEGGLETRRARNIAANGWISVGINDRNQAVIVEGEAVNIAPLTDAGLIADLVGGFAKYRDSDDYEADPANWRDPAGGLWELRPSVAFGWSRFPDTTTRWEFA
ncbi:MAG TPA: pyridoxamine 5'-phosphate oxidase family protein [Candidatus Limnocylindria bacterium]|nr:pyridoxamine 5'-phosphate oxidase family protein [Candidatus Limnocylindria bacterium]